MCYMFLDTLAYTAPIRLVGGSNSNEGRIEVQYKGVWGTICDDFWGINDAHVACHHLGYSGALAYRSSAYYGEGTGPILMDDFHCTGAETRLQDCKFSGWERHNCNHREDAGVVCNTSTSCRQGCLYPERG